MALRTLAAAIIGVTLAWPAMAQNSCLTPDDVARNLRVQHDEHLSVTGITSSGWLIQVFVSDAGTWTQILYEPNTGCATGALSGAGWTLAPAQAGEAL